VTCRESVLELIECARAGRLPGAELHTHLMACRRCQQRWRERWEDERRLTEHFRILRDAVSHQPSIAGRELLMREFDQAHTGGVHAVWRWALNAAAILLVMIALVYDWHRRHPASQVPPDSALAAGVDEGDFVDVPYALPLAPGEFVRVVRTRLDPVALAGMGLDVELDDGAEIPADVLVGEDGFPRGVRVLPETGFLNLE